MDINNLNDDEVKVLLKSLKNPKKEFTLQKISEQISAIFTSISIEEAVIGSDDDIEYVLHIFRGKRDINRYSINLRFKEQGHQLIRIDIGNGHRNPDGSRINGDHIHIYNNNYEKRDHLAYPIEVSDFPNVKLIADAFRGFTQYTNIKDK